MSLQAQTICSLAAQAAKGPGFLVQAGQFLNLVLNDLYQNRNLKMNRVTETIALPANTFGPINLPVNYLRTYDLFYPFPTSGVTLAPGITIFLNQATLRQYDAEFKDTSNANYPYEYATDLSPMATQGNPLLYVYPQSSGALSLTHRYMVQQADITNPQSSAVIPWFPFDKYLVKAVTAELMQITGDDREAQYRKECEEMLQPYLIMDGDEQESVHNIVLDPKHFSSNRGVKLTKSSPLP